MLTTRATRIIGAMFVLATVGVPVTTFAQSGSEVRRPYRGLFGGPSDPRAAQSLVLSSSVFGAYDDNVIAGITEQVRPKDWRQQRSGYYSGATLGLSYQANRQGQRWNAGLGATGGLNYYRRSPDSTFSAFNSTFFNASFELTRSTQIAARIGLTYQPGYHFELTPSDGVGFQEGAVDFGSQDHELFRLASLRSTSTVALTQKLGRNTTLSGGYGFRHARLFTSGEASQSLPDYQTHSLFAGLRHDRPLTRYATLELGYGVRGSTQRTGSGEPRFLHDIRAGINYSRPLSFSRRTSLRFSSGSAVAVNDSLSEDRPYSQSLRLTGAVSLVHEMGRTWSANVNYRRGFVFREAYDNFFFSDSIATGVQGLIARRVSFSAGAAKSWADLARPGATNHSGLTAHAATTYALSRFLGLYARYVYYRHDLGRDVPLFAQTPRQLDRQGVRVGITTSIRLF